MSRFNIVTL